jgi:hypothetical protein
MTTSRFLPAAIPTALVFLAAAPLFAGPFTPVVTLNTVANTGATLIPAGSGTFTSFTNSGVPTDPCISGGNVTFWGAGTGQQGIYASLFGTLTKIADLNTSIPGGTGKFTNFTPVDPCISGGNVAFVGNGLGSQGVYTRIWPTDPESPSQPIKFADFNTAIPGARAILGALYRRIL